MSAAKTETKEGAKQPDPLERIAEALKKQELRLVESGLSGRRLPRPDTGLPLYIVSALENFRDGGLGMAVVMGDWFVIDHNVLAQAVGSGFEPDQVLNDRGDSMNWRLIFKKA